MGRPFYSERAGIKEEMEIRRFIIPGKPQGKARARTVHTKTGYSLSYTPEKTVLYENLIKTSYLEKYGSNERQEGPLEVSLVACFEPPKSISKKRRKEMLSGLEWPTKKPDADNIIKVVLDALNGIAYRDDTQVVHVTLRKMYADAACVVVELKGCMAEA